MDDLLAAVRAAFEDPEWSPSDREMAYLAHVLRGWLAANARHKAGELDLELLERIRWTLGDPIWLPPEV